MTSLEIESTVRDDVQRVLVAAGLANVRDAQTERTNTATSIDISAHCQSPTLPGGVLPTGFWKVAVTVAVHSYMDDDADKATLHALVKQWREAFWVDDVLTDLNAG